MVGEIVEHVRFGRGVVTGFEPPHIDICFDAEPSRSRRFSDPDAATRFLRFERAEAGARAQRDAEQASVASQQELLRRVEENRRREEQLTALRLEAQHKKRTDSAKRAAQRRREALAAKQQER